MADTPDLSQRRRRLRTVLGTVTVGCLLTAGLALPAVRPNNANAAGVRPAEIRPTIVLVHGAWADGSSWSGVVRRLQADGYPVVVPGNPLRGIGTDAASLAAVLRTISGPVVLVGHSYGGAVISNAAAGDPAVKALVFVDAFVPDLGETVLQLAIAQPGSCLGGDPTKVFDLVPAAPNGDVDVYIKRDLYPGCFASDIPHADAVVLAATQRAVALSALGSPSGVPAWRTLPSWYVVGTADRVIPPAEQRIMATRAHARITEVDGSHPSMIGHPDAVTDVIRAAATAA